MQNTIYNACLGFNMLIYIANFCPISSWKCFQSFKNPFEWRHGSFNASQINRNLICLFSRSLNLTLTVWIIVLVSRINWCSFTRKGISYLYQVAKAHGSTSISHRSDAEVPDRYLNDVDPMVFAIWANISMLHEINIALQVLITAFSSLITIYPITEKRRTTVTWKWIEWTECICLEW